MIGLALALASMACARAPRFERIASAFDVKACAAPPCPPGPPLEGPAARDVPHATVVVRRTTDGPFDPHAFTTFEPADPAPPDGARVPVVLFLHGWWGVEPSGVNPMLRHIASRGFDVIYPSYGVAWDPAHWEENAVAALDAALASLDVPGRARPDRSRIAIVGHSMGGILALRLANRAGKAKDPRLPVPIAVVTSDAAGLATPAYPYVSIDDLSAMAPSTQLLVIMSEDSYAMRTRDAHGCLDDPESPPLACNGFGIARRAWVGTPQVEGAHKAALMIPGDADGKSELRSDHNAITRVPADAIATWGYWKLAVGALESAARGRWSEYAFGDTREVRDMGRWSDGHPLRPIVAIGACLSGGPCP